MYIGYRVLILAASYSSLFATILSYISKSSDFMALSVFSDGVDELLNEKGVHDRGPRRAQN